MTTEGGGLGPGDQCAHCHRWLRGERDAAVDAGEKADLDRQVQRGTCDSCEGRVVRGEPTGPTVLPLMAGTTVPVDLALLSAMKHTLAFAAAFIRRQAELGRCEHLLPVEAEVATAEGLRQAITSLLLMDADSRPDALQRIPGAFAVVHHAPGFRDDGSLFVSQGSEEYRRSFEGPTNWEPGRPVTGWNTTHEVFLKCEGSGSGAAPAEAAPA